MEEEEWVISNQQQSVINRLQVASMMESELKDMNSKEPKSNGNSNSNSNSKSNNIGDDRPLLKSDSTNSSSSTTTASDSLQDMEKKYAAFVRRDVYGTMGCGDLPPKEKLLLGFALVTLLPIRVALAMTILVFYYIICRVCTLFSSPNRDDEQEDYAHMGGWRRTVIVRCGRALSRFMLFIFGFYWIPESHHSFVPPTQVFSYSLCFWIALFCFWELESTANYPNQSLHIFVITSERRVSNGKVEQAITTIEYIECLAAMVKE